MSHFITVVHQTVSDRDNADEIETNGPFRVSNPKSSYLGDGYYFWDNHIELAHWWGKTHCANNYVICEGNLSVESDLFFDLLGSRKDQIFFKEMIAVVPGLEDLAIGQIIEYLKELNGRPNKRGIFPFKVIRAIDTSEKSFDQGEVKFANKKHGGMTPLNPQIIICLLEKNKLILQDYNIVYPDKYL